MELDPEEARAMSVPQLQASVSVVPAPVLSQAIVSASGLVRRHGEGDSTAPPANTPTGTASATSADSGDVTINNR